MDITSRCKVIVWLIVSVLVTLFTAFCQAETKQDNMPILLNLDTGSALQVISPINNQTGQALRSEYYQTAIPLARNYGFTDGLRLNVKKRLVGENDAKVFVVSYWQDAGQWEAFKRDPAWPALKALRKDAWQELALYTQTISSPTHLQFHPDKHYTLAFAWLNEKNPKDYYRYIENITPVLDEVGGRFMHKMIYPSFESNETKKEGPGQITLVEWDSAEAIQTLLKHPNYIPHKALLETGVKDFAFYIVEPVG